MKRYLNSIHSAAKFLKDGQKSARFLLGRPPHQRQRIYKRLKEVDPEGLKQVKKETMKLTRIRMSKKKMAKQKIRKTEDAIVREARNEILAVAQKSWADSDVAKFRYVPAETVLKILACLKVAGYSNEELVKELGVDEQLLTQVTMDMIKRVKKNLSEFIVMSADKKVFHDLLTGTVSEDTARADMIAARRRKIVLDVAKLAEDRQRKGLLPPDIEKKEKQYEERFGVKDITGETEDVTDEKEGEKEDDMGQD